jgi:hypothetical protein
MTDQIFDASSITKQLELAKLVIDEKALLDLTSNVIFKSGKLYAGNDKLLFVSPISLNLEFATNGSDLYKIFSGIPGEAKIRVEDNKLFITSKKLKAELASWEVDPSMNWIKSVGISDDMEWSPLPESFWDALNWCRFSASKDMSVRVLTCLRIKNNEVSSADSYRVSRYKLESDMEIDVLIPKENVETLLKLPELTEFCLITKEDVPTWLCFREPESNLICGTRLVIGKFPDIGKFFKEKGDPITLPGELRVQVARANKFIDSAINETSSVIVTVMKDRVQTTVIKSTGILDQFADFEYEGEEFSFITIPALFEQILNKAAKVSVKDHFLLFEVENFSHVLQVRYGKGE